jgi:ABC-type transport system involved in multi-copper enzyme maturation permease subunit
MLLFVQGLRSWLARHVPWSNSAQAWRERGAGVLVLASALALWRWAGPLPLVAQLSLWCLLLLVAGYLWRRSWIQLFGPVLLFEMMRTGRRRRFFLLRAAYAFMLLGILLCVYCSWFLDRRLTFWEMMRGASLRAHDLAEFAGSFFYVFMSVQFLTVLWLTPAYTAGAIAVEKERQTLDALLTTDLRNREIVLSTYVSRLANLIMLLLAGLPILALLQFMGGVDPNLVLAGFAGTGITVISLAALGTVHSLYAKKPRDAVMRTYLAAAAYLVLSGMSWLLLLPQLNLANFPSTEEWTSPIELEDIVPWGSIGNPVAVIIQLIHGINKGGRLDLLLPPMLEKYAWFHGLLALGCGVVTVIRFRSKVLEPRETIPKGSRRKIARRRFWRAWTGRPPVSQRAVFWKEVFVDVHKRRRLIGWLASGIVLAAIFVPAIHIVHFFGRILPLGTDDSLSVMMSYWVRGASAFLGCAMLLGVAVRAASCVSGERDRQTLDGLLATPLDNRTILWEKWLGCIFSQRWTAVGLMLIWVIGYLTGSLHPLAIPCFVAAWLGYAGFAAGLGLWFSVANRSTLRSVFGTLCTMVLLLGVLLLAAFDIPEAWLPKWIHDLWAFFLLPPMTLGLLAFSPADFQNWLTGKLELYYVPVMLGIQFVWWSVVAGVMVMLANIRFRVVTGRTSGLPNPPCALPEMSAPLRGAVKPLPAPTIPLSRDAQRSALTSLLATSETNPNDDPDAYEEVSGPSRSWRLVGWTLFLLPLAAVLGWYGYSHYAAEKSLQEAIANADQLDLGWRLDELEAKRAVIPDEENSMNVVREVKTRLPKDWAENVDVKFYDHFLELAPEKQLTERQINDLTELFKRYEPILVLARRLADMPHGRAPITWNADGLFILLVDTQNARTAANVLWYDTLFQAQKGNADGALISCRGIINTARSIGDEPFIISMLVRTGVLGLGIGSVERTLAQGEPGEGAMRALQQLLEEEEKEPLFLIGLRGERANWDHVLEHFEKGKAKIKEARNLWGGPNEVVLMSGSLKGQRAAFLKLMNEYIEAAKLPEERQDAEFKRIDLTLTQQPSMVKMVVPATTRLLSSFRRSQALLHTAIVALAVERFRREHGRWPDTVAELVPGKLQHVYIDPYDGKPLRYRRNSDGVVIYSVGPDLVDNGGKMDRTNRMLSGTDVGIQLWDPTKRRQPPAPPKSAEEGEQGSDDDK